MTNEADQKPQDSKKTEPTRADMEVLARLIILHNLKKKKKESENLNSKKPGEMAEIGSDADH